MSETTADLLVERLREWGVARVTIPTDIQDMEADSRSKRNKFAQSLLRVEPNREKVALTVLSDQVRELV